MFHYSFVSNFFAKLKKRKKASKKNGPGMLVNNEYSFVIKASMLSVFYFL